MSQSYEGYMRQALALGRRAMGQTWPNPAVGCVIVKEGCVVGRGWTQPFGRPHAEPQALAMAGDQVRGADVYVTLEPCAHFGKTPPCAQALIDAGVGRVIGAISDKDPRVSGKGFDMLRAAGVKVITGVCASEALQDHAGFFLRLSQGRPWVTLKLAFSLDGKIATSTGESQWITARQARQKVHALRACHDAVMVGGGTARADDPSLTVRGFGARRQPVRVVVSNQIDVPLMSTLAQTARDVPVWMCHGPALAAETAQAWDGLGAQLLPCEAQRGQVDPASVLRNLGEQGLTRVFCEGGGQLVASLLAQDLVDELHVFHAGLALGSEGKPGVGALGITRLAQAQRFALADVSSIGPDTHQIWRRA